MMSAIHMTATQMKQQTITVLITTPPHGSDAASQGLDTALACAAFDQNVAVIFQGDGVWQLLDQPLESPLGDKSLLAQFKLMELYGVTSVMVCTESLANAALTDAPLGLSVQTISPQQIAEHLATQTQVWVY
jgi:tRNA 2-thiouridine synthesizing protein C